MKRVNFKDLLKILAATIVLFVLVEGLLRAIYFVRNSMVDYVPLPYVIGDDYGPIPPWVDDLRILQPDDTLFWKNRPTLRRRYIDIFSPVWARQEPRSVLRQFLPAIPTSLKGNPVWEISLNSDGYRDAEFPEEKRSSAFRIICLGDSWTFGANVGQEQAYPQQLEELLRQEYPTADFEVFNLGVLGYSSYQGLQLLRRRGLDLDPDLFLIGFSMNDAKVAGYRDKDLPAYNKEHALARKIDSLADRIESYKLLRHWVRSSTYKPKPLSYYLKKEHEAAANDEGWELSERRLIGPQAYKKLEPWTRVSLSDYEKNILEMISLARSKGAGVLLLNNELWPESPYLTVLRRISEAEHVPLVDSSLLIYRARRKMEAEVERELNLLPPKARRDSHGREIEVIFRAYVGDRVVSRAIYIVGVHPKLGHLVPNKIRMYDDGTHGDQRPGDKVWSYAATFSPGTKLFYVYTNSGAEGQWEGLDVPHIRAFRVHVPDGKATIYRPIESFGKIYMQADAWHTNSAGYELIAKAILGVLKFDPTVQSYLDRVATQSLHPAESMGSTLRSKHDIYSRS